MKLQDVTYDPRVVAALIVAQALVSPSSNAQETQRDKAASKAGADAMASKAAERRANAASVPKGHILTFYGLRKLEHDVDASDEEKLREWEAYIKRTKGNLKYAYKAVERWKSAARLRVVDSVQKDDRDKDLRPREKLKRWKRLMKLYPRSKEARIARKRISFWRSIETKLLVESAEETERSGGPKVARIKAWKAVLEWVPKGSEAKAARRRISLLQNQLYTEAISLDRISRIDAATKLAGWRDVLAGEPTSKQRQVADRRIRELIELGNK